MQLTWSVVRAAGGVRLAVLRAAAGGGLPRAHTLLFAHATGFCKEVTLGAVLAQRAGRTAHVLSVPTRCGCPCGRPCWRPTHRWTSWPSTSATTATATPSMPASSKTVPRPGGLPLAPAFVTECVCVWLSAETFLWWPALGEDLCHVAEHLRQTGAHEVVGVGHSGASLALLCTRLRTEPWGVAQGAARACTPERLNRPRGGRPRLTWAGGRLALGLGWGAPG
jgi:hypothetical protein